MDKDFFKDWDPCYNRTVTNIYINNVPADPGYDHTHFRQYAPFDIFPTSLAAIGVQIKGDRLGIRTNLFSDRPTLAEELGLEKLAVQLNARSLFYGQHREQPAAGDDYTADD